MDPNPLSTKLVLISDLHIGGDPELDDFECKNEFVSFLDHLEKDNKPVELLILGDFLDLWKYHNNNDKITTIVHAHRSIFERLKKFGEKNRITVIGGNHDHELVYNKKFQEDLLKFNIHVDINQFFKREFTAKGKIVRIIGEHGNQVEPATSFPDFKMPTESSLSYHLSTQLVHKIMNIGNEKKRPLWIKSLDNLDVDLLPFWFISKYFYNEIGPVLKTILVPMLILFSLAIPYFIFDLIRNFYQPDFLMPIFNFIDTNIFMKMIIFVLYFDMVIVILIIILSFFRKDFRKRLQQYGVQSLSEILIAKHKSYVERSQDVLKGDNPFKEKGDIYIIGHTHTAELKKHDDFIIADTGSWKQLMYRMPAHFNFPPVFYPYFLLTYIVCSSTNEGFNIQLRAWPKDFTPGLTLLERFAVKRMKSGPKPYLKDTLLKEITLD